MEKIEDYEAWLYNPEQRALPSICFKDGKPQFMTCNDHKNKCKLHRIHCCRTKRNLPIPIPDHKILEKIIKNSKQDENYLKY